MSTFRNSPKPGEKELETSNFGETLLSRPDLPPAKEPSSNFEMPAMPEGPRSTFTSFTDRETRAGPAPLGKCTNIIAAGSKWNGTLTIDDSVRIEGHLSGQVTARGTVHIVEGARVDAKVRANFVVVSGSVKGEVRCDERLELMPKSRVEGSIITKVLNAHEGAIIDGSIQMSASKTATNDRNGDETAEPELARSESRGTKALT